MEDVTEKKGVDGGAKVKCPTRSCSPQQRVDSINRLWMTGLDSKRRLSDAEQEQHPCVRSPLRILHHHRCRGARRRCSGERFRSAVVPAKKSVGPRDNFKSMEVIPSLPHPSVPLLLHLLLLACGRRASQSFFSYAVRVTKWLSSTVLRCRRRLSRLLARSLQRGWPAGRPVAPHFHGCCNHLAGETAEKALRREKQVDEAAAQARWARDYVGLLRGFKKRLPPATTIFERRDCFFRRRRRRRLLSQRITGSRLPCFASPR